MANAAAKKAAQARAAASATYFPIVAGLNVIHLLLRLYQWDAFTSSQSNIVLNALLLGLTAFAYKGILDDHAESVSKSTTKVVGGGKSNEKLAGGASLDLLAFGCSSSVWFGSRQRQILLDIGGVAILGGIQDIPNGVWSQEHGRGKRWQIWQYGAEYGTEIRHGGYYWCS